MIRVLWLTRHRPYPEIMDALVEAFGPVELIQHKSAAGNGYNVMRLIDQHRADRVVAVLPWDLTEQVVRELKQRGLPPMLRPVFHYRDEHGEPLPHKRFMGFEEVLEAKVKTRRL